MFTRPILYLQRAPGSINRKVKLYFPVCFLQKLIDLPLEMVEAVLMRTFLMLYSSDCEDEDDDRRQHKPGKSNISERRAFTLLSLVCRNWWKTMSGWPESPTSHWLKHQLRRLIERECMKN